MTESKHDNLDQELQRWKERLESGLVTQEMYEQAVKRLLDHAPGVASAPYSPAKATLVELMPGMEIGPDNHRFRLKREIGGGAMGRVWQAHDLSAEALEGGTHYKALKVVAPELMRAKRALENLKREALRASKLNHSNIINVNGWQQGRDNWLFVEMEYLEGHDLDHLLFEEGEHGLPLERVLGLLKQMAKALDYAHQEHQIIHRDLKPGNVYITEADRIKILDFGLAYQLRQSSSSVANSATGDSSGTPIYMSPEAFVAGKPDPRQDVYALACLTYELLTGQPPYSEEAARTRPANLYPPQPEGITDQAWELLKQGFGYEREMRPDGAGVFYQRFSDALREQVEVRVEGELNPAQKDQETEEQEKPEAEAAARIELKKLQREAEQGDAYAQFNLGVRYANGQGVGKDEKEAVSWYRQAAEQGYASAQNNLGWMYEGGRGVTKDEKEAVSCYRQAAEQGDAGAQFNLGVMYANGRGVTKDEKEAVSCYRQAAEQGDADAQYSLGVMYANGRGVTKDEKEAVKWYYRAAQQGYASAQYNLGLMFAYGRGVLGRMFAYGRGVTKDEKEAVKWYRLAAEQGHASAQYNLGLMYENGRGVIGRLTTDGRVVIKDKKEAMRWYRKAAEQNEPDAIKALKRLKK